VDEAEAERTPFGRWVAASSGLLGWAVRTDEIGAVAARLGLEVGGGSRVRDDGRVLTWQLAGVEQAIAEPSLPFFVQWGDGVELPGSSGGPFRLTGVELSGDPARLAEWLGSHELPVEITHGEPAVTRVTLSGPGGKIEIRAPYTVD
jgi:hypothetical protein